MSADSDCQPLRVSGGCWIWSCPTISPDVGSVVCMTGISMEKSFLQGADIFNEGRDHYSNHQSSQPHQPFAVNVNNSFFSSFFIFGECWKVHQNQGGKDRSKCRKIVMAMKVQSETFGQGLTQKLTMLHNSSDWTIRIHWHQNICPRVFVLRSNFTWARKVLFRWVSNWTLELIWGEVVLFGLLRGL